MATVTVIDTPNQIITIPSSTTFSIGGSTTYIPKTISNTYTMAPADTMLFVDPTAGSFTLTLPSASGFNSELHITCIASNTNVVTLKPTGVQTVSGASSVSLGNTTSAATWKGGVHLVSDGTNWWIVDPVSSGGGGGGSGSPLVVAAPLAGATASTRFVGGTAAGAPTSGTFALGDFVVAENGAIWVCTAAGSPGTWVNVGGSTSSGKAKITPLAQNLAYPVNTAAGSGGAVVFGDVNYTATGGQCFAWLSGTAETTVNSGITLSLYLEVDDVVSTANATSFNFASGSAGLKGTFPHTIIPLGTLTAAVHKFRVRAQQNVSTKTTDVLNVGIMEV